MTFNISPETRDAYLNLAMNIIAERVAPSKTMHQDAWSQYIAIANMLDNNPKLAPYSPVVRAQGSMRIRTTTRSYKNDDNFDVDMIVELRNIPHNWTQKMVKELVLDAFLSDSTYGSMVKDKSGGRRCITIEYANNSHVDILPCVIDDIYIRTLQNGSRNPANYILAITDKNSKVYETSIDRSEWPHSNPIGFADWFLTIALKNENKHKGASALMLRAEIERFPAYQSPEDRTILQKIVMLLKRNRDVRIGEDDDKPVSILLTTLAALAYDEAPIGNLWDTLCYVASNMKEKIKFDGTKAVVLNPVLPKENFADKWPEKPRKQAIFFRWLEMLQADLKQLARLSGNELVVKLKDMFGEKPVTQAVVDYANKIHQDLRSGGTGIAASTGGITKATNRIVSPIHTNLAGNQPTFPSYHAAIPPHAQLHSLLEKYPTSTGKIIPGGVEWSMKCRPTPISDEYTIRIRIRKNTTPVIEILKPTLVRSFEGAEFNHMYRDGHGAKQQPCIYAPGEWTSLKRISDTLVPWTCEWCFFYETWLATGKWLGGGTHNGEYRE